jgi:hypothetical protein
MLEIHCLIVPPDIPTVSAAMHTATILQHARGHSPISTLETVKMLEIFIVNHAAACCSTPLRLQTFADLPAHLPFFIFSASHRQVEAIRTSRMGDSLVGLTMPRGPNEKSLNLWDEKNIPSLDDAN